MKLVLLCCAILLAFFPPSAYSLSLSEKYQIAKPLATDKQKRVFSTLFDVELWSAGFPKAYDKDMTIRIVFASRFDNEQIVSFLVDEAEELHDFSKAQYATLKNSLSRSLTCSSRAGTVLDLNYQPGLGIFVTCKGNTHSVPLADGPLSFYLLDVFLHPDSEFENLSNH